MLNNLNCCKLVLLILVPFCIHSVHAAKSTKRIKPKDETILSDVTTMLIYQNSGTKVDHQEISTVSGFQTLEHKSDIQMNIIGLDASKEFLRSNFISFNLNLRASIILGMTENENDINDVNDLTYKDKASGLIYSGGLTINLNTRAFGLKVQPFVGTNYAQSSQEFSLSYANVDTGTDSNEIEYDTSRSFLQHSLGVRFYNNKNIMSYFSLDYIQELSQSTSATGTRSGVDLQMTNVSIVEQSPFAFSIGAGFKF
jgi:hypothetical protein